MSQRKRRNPAEEKFEAGQQLVRLHPLFRALLSYVHVYRSDCAEAPQSGWAVVHGSRRLYAHPTRMGEPEEWAYVLGLCLLHLGFEHLQKRAHPRLWNAACDSFVARFLHDLRFGKRPSDVPFNEEIPALGVEELYDLLCQRQLELPLAGTAGTGLLDMLGEMPDKRWYPLSDALADGLREAVQSAVESAAQRRGSRRASARLEACRKWFVSHYPLLGALAASFEIVEEAAACTALDISVAAVDAEDRKLFFNPGRRLDSAEARFVMAHEMLHVGLSHARRCQGRDPFLWNVACDFVLNDWLIEMDVGKPPCGLLHDPVLRGLSAEAVYDLIVRDLRRYRKLATFRGVGACDVLPSRQPGWWNSQGGVDLDEFYRSCLLQGLHYWQDSGRGFLPAGLVQEIQALQQPPIPWDVELAQWFDAHFAPREQRRTFARPSRRQSSTPDIPRPRYVREAPDCLRTFAVVLDTSGSMNSALLGKALGSIASYSVAREVEAVRLVFCDAAPYDQGMVRPEEIACRVQVKGRGGTVLQPGLDLLERDAAFPPNAPVLVITDGQCDVLQVRREHAFLVPAGAVLPFSTRAPIFRVQ